MKFPISARFWMSSFFTPDERIFHQRPIRKLWSQCNDSIDHAYMGFDRNRVRFMIAHDFVGIGKWLPGKPQASVNRGKFRQRKVSAKAERCSVLMT
ncbi:MAG: hypothetical protein WCH75_12910, partial [Candidatus Binatia bacterium]